MGKRRAPKTRRPQPPPKPAGGSAPEAEPASLPRWLSIACELLIIALVIAVPIVINHRSRNGTDVKDATLGLGVTAGLAAWLVAGLARGRLSWISSRLNALVLAYFGWAAVSVCYARVWHVAISEFGRLAANVGLYLLAVASLRTSQQARRVATAAVLGSIPVCIYAFAQAAGYDYVRYYRPGRDMSRVFSFLGNPTYLGGYLVLLIPLAVALAWPRLGERGNRSLRRVLAMSAGFALVAGMMSLALYLSYTMAALIGLFLGTGVCLLLAVARGGRRVLRIAVPAMAAGLVMVVALGVVAYQHMPPGQRKRVQKVLRFQDPYSQERQLHWRTAYSLFRDSPIIGNGYGNFRALGLERMASEWYLQAPERRQGLLALGYAHNEYLQALSDMGVVGGLLFLALLAAALWLTVRTYWRAQEPLWRHLALACLAGLLAFLFQNIFGVTFHQTGAVAFFWLWLATMAMGSSALAPQPAPAAAPVVRQIQFRRLSPTGAAVAGAVLALAWAILAWQVINPIRAALFLRASEQAAVYAQAALADAQQAYRRGDEAAAAAAQQQASFWYQEAVAKARRATELCPHSAMAFYELAFAEGQLGDLSPAPEVQRAQFERALAAGQRAVALMPGSGPMHYNLAVTYKRLGRLAEAEASFREAVRLSPTIGRHYAALAETLMEEGKLAEAEPLALKAAEIDDHDAGVRLFVAKLYSRMGEATKAADWLEQAASLDPTDPSIRRQSTDLWLGLRQYRRALAAAEEWVALDSRSAEAHLKLGVCQYHLGHFPQARASLEQALRLNPELRGARFYLALTLRQLGQREEAEWEMRQIASRWPDTLEGRAAAQILRSARPQAAPPVASP